MKFKEIAGQAGIAELRAAGVRTLDKFPVKEVSWIWKPYIPKGKVTILQGDPSSGKTSLMLMLLSAISNGRMIPGASEDAQTGLDSGFALYQTAEDGMSDTIVPRLSKYGANLSNLFCMTGDSAARLTLTDGTLENVLFAVQPEIAVLDPIQAFLGDGVDMHRANEIRPIFSYLADLADVTETAIVLVGHLNKNAGGESLYRGLGSIDIAAAARSVLLFEKDKKGEVRTLRHIKSSLAPNGKPLDYVFDEKGRLSFRGIHTDEPKVEKASKALLMSYDLRAMLGAGSREVEDVKAELSKKFGVYSSNTWTEAKRLAEIESFKQNGKWMLQVSKEADFGKVLTPEKEEEQDGRPVC